MPPFADDEPIVARLVCKERLDVWIPNAASMATSASVACAADRELPAHQRHARAWQRWPTQFARVTLAGAVHAGRVASLITVLALLTAIPVFQLLAFGYMLETTGRLARGASIRAGLPWYPQIGRVGLALFMLFLCSLPVHLLTHWAQVAEQIDPRGEFVGPLRRRAILAAVVAFLFLSWAWIRGGRLRDYLWPAPLRFCKRIWRWSTWTEAKESLWQFLVSFEIPRLFGLGLRCTLATLVWVLLPAVLIMTVLREGEGGGAGFVGLAAIATMAAVLVYLPLLQAHFAAENRVAAMFELPSARDAFRRAPVVLACGIAATYLLAIPLYLLKIEATPREAMWLPCLFFVVLMLPARIIMGLAMRRARRASPPRGAWQAIVRWTARSTVPAIVAVYLVVLYLSQYVYWDGLQTWVEQHAILAPVPFKAT